jgi:hypothetical protein
MLKINWNPTSKQLQLFSTMQMAFCWLLAVGVFRHTNSLKVPLSIATLAAVMGLIGISMPPRIRIVYVAWTAAMLPFGWIVSHLLLAAIFYLLMTPTALTMRIFRYDPLQRSFDRYAKSYWIPRAPTEELHSYFKQY